MSASLHDGFVEGQMKSYSQAMRAGLISCVWYSRRRNACACTDMIESSEDVIQGRMCLIQYWVLESM